MSTEGQGLAVHLGGMVEFAHGGIVSKAVAENEAFKVILFCIEAGQELSEHTASAPATIQVLQGKAAVVVGDQAYEAVPGAFYAMPAHLPHSVRATEDLVFLLVMGA